MKIKYAILCLLLTLSGAMAAQDNTDQQPAGDNYSAWLSTTRGQLERLLGAPLLSTTQMGLMVYDLNMGVTVFAHNEQQRMWPASTLQLVTAITALDMLGPEYGYHTSICYRGSLVGDTLRGDLYCVGGFDPTLTRDDLRAFADTIRRFGIRCVDGMVVADLSMKDALPKGNGWCWDEPYEPLTPLLVDRKDEFMSVLMREMRDAGIRLNVTLATGQLPQGCTEIYRHRTDLEKVLNPMLKNGDNLYAESMFYQIAKGNTTKTAKASDASKAEKQLVGRLGLDGANYTFADGSGISLYSYVTPELMIYLMRHACYNREMFTRLYPALPISGRDGTLRARMASGPCRRNVHAMAGASPGVAALAGYCQASNGHTLCFALFNQGLVKPDDAFAFQDKVCEALCK